MSSRELDYMVEHGLINNLSIRFGVIGAGQKGNKEADILAGYKFSDGTICYPSLAINFAEPDMLHLKNIPEEDRITFDGLKGAARTPALVVEYFDPKVNKQANEMRQKLANAMSKKFEDIDHLLITLGAGGGFGTGFGSLVLSLIKEGFFPVPVTLLFSIPFDDQDEMANALLLMDEIRQFMDLQVSVFEPTESKPLASAITTDNRWLCEIFERKKNLRGFQQKALSWKDESNHATLSIIHESNVIPANFGSDNITFDPSDLMKLVQLSGKFITFAKARIDPEYSTDVLEKKMKASIDNGFFSCGHHFNTATMYGGFIIRPGHSAFFKDIATEKTIKKVLGNYQPLTSMSGKYGDPIWTENYAVAYTMFAGLGMPERFAQLAEELKELKDRDRTKQQQQMKEVDISVAKSSVQNAFNPYKSKAANRFGSDHTDSSVESVFSRKASPQEQENQSENNQPSSDKKAFGLQRDRFERLRNTPP
ncbi:cell division protein FtsZ [Brevibacillus sp. SYSU BS000544]|uniref:cell division protein FtsZ n=1 Tax=Brevibacillus sp. SYSU BS000544 TaxID=3416443 RepID=UPI003CE4B88A